AAARDDEPMAVFQVDTGALDVFLSERGNLEASGSARVSSPIEGQTTILMLPPEGTRVVEGQLVCELDSAALKDRLANQQVAVERAGADRDNAAKSLEVAELNVREYRDVTYPQEVR